MCSKSLIRPGWCLTGTAAALLFLACPARAQQDGPATLSAGTHSLDASSVTVTAPAQPFRQFDRVEITGSSILRKEQTQTLPVQVITRQDIQNSGARDLAEFLQRLPVMSGFSHPGILLLTRGGVSSAALHGMPTGTLLLINGKRQAPYGRQTISGDERTSVELGQLPLSVIERIELLTDGASSLYGTDAIAGVVNIITQSEKQGLEMSASISVPDQMKGIGRRAGLSYGRGSHLRDGFNWFFAAELEEQQQLLGVDRPYASAGRQFFDHSGQKYATDGIALTPFQSGVPTLATSTSAPFTKVWNSSHRQGACNPGQVPMRGQLACLYNPYPEFGIYPALDTLRIYAKGSVQLDGNAVGYVEVIYNDRRQQMNNRVWDTYASRIGRSASDPGYDLALANGFTPGSTFLLFRPTELGAWARSYSDSNSRLLAGVKGDWQGWRYNASLYQSESQASYSSQGATYPNLGRTTDQSRTLTTDTLLRPLLSSDASSQAITAALLDARQFRTIEKGTTKIQALDFSATSTLFEWDGEPVLIGLGSELRRHQDQFTSFVSAQQPDFMAQRTVFAQFAEVQWPVAQGAEVITALRNDHYSDFGNTTHGKVSAKWKPSSQWLVRGSIGSGFRAPTLGQMQDTSIYSSSFISSNCNAQLNQLATQLTTAGGPQGYCGSDGRMWISTNGSSGLKPELSKQLSWGLQLTPSSNHVWSADYWRVEMRDTLRQYPASLAMSNPLLNSQYFRLDNEVNKGRLDLYLPMVNLGQSVKSGVDFSWSYRLPTEWGRFFTHVTGTRFLKSEQTIAPELGTTSDLGKFSVSSSSVTPRLQAQWTVGLTRADWNAQATAQYVAGYTDGDITATNLQTNQTVVVQGRKVPAFATLNLSGTYRLNKNTGIQATVINALNTRAPLSYAQNLSTLHAYNTTLSNLWGRTVQLALTVKF